VAVPPEEVADLDVAGGEDPGREPAPGHHLFRMTAITGRRAL
jgi:hypothetical protein